MSILFYRKTKFFWSFASTPITALGLFYSCFLGIDSKQNQKFAGKINTEPLLLLPSLCHDRPT